MSTGARPGAMGEPSKWSTWIPLGLLAFQLAWTFAAVFLRRFNSDEFEHLHASWRVLQGDVPYVDFFEHHNPLAWLLLAPIVALSPESPDVLLYARLLMWLLFLGSAFLVHRIGKQLLGARAALWAAAIWVSMMSVQTASIEIRPDPPMTCCLLLAYLLALDSGLPRQAAAGAAFGVAFLFLQKAVLFAPVLLMLPLFERSGGRAAWFRRLGAMALGALAPLALGAGWLLATESLGAWWSWSVVFNKTTPPIEGSWIDVSYQPLRFMLLHRNTLPIVFMLVGIWALLRNVEWRTSARLIGGALLLLGSLAVTKRPYDQYWLSPLAMAAFLGGAGVAHVLSRAGSARRELAFTALFAGCMLFQHHPRWTTIEGPSYRIRKRQEARFEYAQARTRPDELVFQGYPPFSIHRRGATFFWFLPFDLPVRAERLGLGSVLDFRAMVREKRPAVMSIGPAQTYKSIDTFALHHEWLVGEAGYEWNEKHELYVLAADTSR